MPTRGKGRRLDKGWPGRDARRLLDALAADGAHPAREDLREGFLAVSAARNGVTCIIANTPRAAGDELVARNLAVWSGTGAGRRLSLLPEGSAFARRLAAAPGSDPFAAQHRSLASKSFCATEAPVIVDDRESPIAWLARRRGAKGTAFLAPAQVEAGERFARDVTIALLRPRVTSNWSGAAGVGGQGPQEIQVCDLAIAARQRLDRAAAAVGPELNGLLVDICGFQKGLELVERERSWPPRAAKVVLRIALDRLASHYGLSSEARGPRATGRLQSWGAADFRPVIESEG